MAVWLLLALAIPAQATAAFAQGLPCAEGAASGAVVVTMDCHPVEQPGAAGEPDCCGSTCPDMMACAAAHAALPSSVTAVLFASDNERVGYLSGGFAGTSFAPPFRPPAYCHA
jgi:hypothetical protein